MVLGGVLLLILFFLVWLLFRPINLVIDTPKNQFYLEIKPLVKATFELDKNHFVRINFTFLFWKKQFYPVKELFIKKKQSKKTTGNINMSLKQIVSLLNSFKIKRFYLNLDTGNCIYNAKLYPVFSLMNYYKGGFNINFEGRNQLILYVNNRPINIIKAFINTKK